MGYLFLPLSAVTSILASKAYGPDSNVCNESDGEQPSSSGEPSGEPETDSGTQLSDDGGAEEEI
jgi:hypothetical protein